MRQRSSYALLDHDGRAQGKKKSRTAFAPAVSPEAAPDGSDVEKIVKMVKIRTAQCPMKRMDDAWDVAHAALFLASDEARYITGAELVLDGGLSYRAV